MSIINDPISRPGALALGALAGSLAAAGKARQLTVQIQ